MKNIRGLQGPRECRPSRTMGENTSLAFGAHICTDTPAHGSAHLSTKQAANHQTVHLTGKHATGDRSQTTSTATHTLATATACSQDVCRSSPCSRQISTCTYFYRCCLVLRCPACQRGHDRPGSTQWLQLCPAKLSHGVCTTGIRADNSTFFHSGCCTTQ